MTAHNRAVRATSAPLFRSVTMPRLMSLLFTAALVLALLTPAHAAQGGLPSTNIAWLTAAASDTALLESTLARAISISLARWAGLPVPESAKLMPALARRALSSNSLNEPCGDFAKAIRPSGTSWIIATAAKSASGSKAMSLVRCSLIAISAVLAKSSV